MTAEDVKSFFEDPLEVRILEVRGDRWTGKSTLLRELAEEATRRGRTVVTGRAAAKSSKQVPFSLFLEIMDDLAGHADVVDTDIRPQPEAPSSPALESLLHTDPRHFPEDPAVRYRRFRAIRAMLPTMCGPAGLLVVLDDVHRADEASLDLLEYLLRHPPRESVLFALAHRPRQTGPRLHATLNDAVHEGRAVRVTPSQLTEEQAQALIPDEVSQTLRSSMLRTSGRNPVLLKAFASLGSVLGGRRIPSADLPQDILVETLRDFHALSRSSWTVARSAAILAEPFTPGLLQAVSQTTDDELHAAMDELVGEDILKADGPRTLSFSSPLLRAAAHQASGPGWLLGAHARAAESLAETSGDCVELAAHLQYQMAANDSGTSRILLEAASAHRWVDAVQARIWAEAAHTAGGTADSSGRPSLVLGSLLASTGRFEPALDVLADASHLRTDHDYEVAAAAWWAWTMRMLGMAEAAEHELAIRLKEMTDARAEDLGPILTVWMECALQAGTPVPEAAVNRLDGLCERLSASLRGHAYALGAVAAMGCGSMERSWAQERAAAAARILDGLDDDTVVQDLDGLYWLARAEAALGRPSPAARHLERGLRLAELHGLHGFVPLFADAVARAEQQTGNTSGALRYATVAMKGAEETDSRHLRDVAGRLLMEMSVLSEPAAPDVVPPGPGSSRTSASALPERSRPGAGGLDALSKRELEIAVLVSDGRTNQQIARTLSVSQKTVETHLGRIFKKLVVSSRAEVAALIGRSFAHACG
ncbi:LuxR C-terminal-related transcriptional regulator [Streptomyces bottropensis]|uniref:helix-turn-helix transcriptional regulator n=1 Tax=Streptomyces bottropensis TaxID=42235 RepID=UPI00369F7ACF